jgi:hypothetical protein
MNFIKGLKQSFSVITIAISFVLLLFSVSAKAVNLAQDNIGDVLLFPYFTTRDGWTSLFTISNTNNKTVVAKLRWREGKNGRSVRDVNVILSPYDTWTVGIRSVGDGAGIFTTDNSCTLPKLPSLANIGRNQVTGLNFTNAAYANIAAVDNRDNGGTTLDRSKEGYFEVIEMGTISSASSAGNNAEQIAFFAEHVGDGWNNTALPRDCGSVRALFDGENTFITAGQLEPPENNLIGEGILVKGVDGKAAGYIPTVLANFSDKQIYSSPNSLKPDLGSISPLEALIISDASPKDPVRFIPASGRGIDAVSELISRRVVINYYNVTGDSGTSWVMTFPTKHFYVDRPLFESNTQSPLSAGTDSLAPFDSVVNGEVFGAAYDESQGKSCFDATFNFWDREGSFNVAIKYFQYFETLIIQYNNLCFESNIISFGGYNSEKGLFSSKIVTLLGGTLYAANGKSLIFFGEKDSITALPVIGFKVEIRNRGDASVNYGFATEHFYKR